MHKEVFSTPAFAEYAKKNLVLVQADFPSKKPQSDALKKANQELKNKYATPFGGFPTLVILDSEGKKLGQEVGYGGGGPKLLIAKLDKYKKQ